MVNFNNLQYASGREQLGQVERVPFPRNEAQITGQKTLDHLREMQAQLDRANANADSALNTLNSTVANKVAQLNGTQPEPRRRSLFRR